MMVDFPLLLGPTNGLEGDFGEEQLVTVTFKESGGKTKMTLRHVGFPPGRNGQAGRSRLERILRQARGEPAEDLRRTLL